MTKNQHKPYDVDLAIFPSANLPVIQPTAMFTPAAPFAGAWTVAGDLDGDGIAELVQVRMWEKNDVHAIAAASAYRLDGTLLWRWGAAGSGVAALHSDAPCQVYDWDGDGRQEVVIATHSHIIVLDGASGRERWRFALPAPDATDCIVFANLGGGDHADVLLKTRYHHIWAYTWQGKLLWESVDPAGMMTAHQPLPLDLDGDGCDEIIAGYALLDQDGKPLWSLDGAALGLGTGHLDCARVLQRGNRLEDWRLVFTCCGDKKLLCLDGYGRVVWEKHGLHFESLSIGRMIPGSTGKQILVDIDHAAPGKSPMHLYNPDGVLLGELNSSYSRIHRLINWGDDDSWKTTQIVACGERFLVSGETGQPLARFATPLPAGIIFDQSENPPEHQELGPFHLLAHTGALYGHGRQDLLFSTNPGGMVWSYRNPGGALAVKPAPGTGINVTLY